MAVPWLRRLAAGLPPRRPGFDPGSVHVGFVVDKLALGQVFACQFHSTGPPLLRIGQKIIIIIIFIIGLHGKTHGCSAYVASAAGPFTTKKKLSIDIYLILLTSKFNFMKETAITLHWSALKSVFRKSHPQSQLTNVLHCEYRTWKR
jgi:hypothetical protein